MGLASSPLAPNLSSRCPVKPHDDRRRLTTDVCHASLGHGPIFQARNATTAVYAQVSDDMMRAAASAARIPDL